LAAPSPDTPPSRRAPATFKAGLSFFTGLPSAGRRSLLMNWRRSLNVLFKFHKPVGSDVGVTAYTLRCRRTVTERDSPVVLEEPVKPSRRRCQVVWHWRAWTCQEARVVSGNCVSVTHSGLSDVLPGGMGLRAKLSVSGSGQSVSTGAEVVRDSAERDQRTLRVLG
jgi:hypothetical protein